MPMAYQLVYTERAVRDIKRLDRVAAKRLGKKLLEFSKAPLRYSKKIHDPNLGNYRFRVGDYRVIFDLDKNKIVILRVGHRREIYRSS